MPRKSTKKPTSKPVKKTAQKPKCKKQGEVKPEPFFMTDDYVIEEKMWCEEKDRKELTIVCLYNCPNKAKCRAYYLKYGDILLMPIPAKYLDKYGAPDLPVPDALIRKRKMEEKAAKEQVKANKKAIKVKKEAEREAKEEAKLSKTVKRKVKEPAGADSKSKKIVKESVKKDSSSRKKADEIDLDFFGA